MVCCSLFVVCCSLSVVVVCVACCLLFAIYGLFFVGGSLLDVLIGVLVFGVCRLCWVFVVCGVRLVVC